MIRRLLMALLAACLAIPAVASPLHCLEREDQAAMVGDAHHAHGEHRQAPDTLPAKHDCIGCIAPLASAGAPGEPMAFPPPPPLGRERLPAIGTNRGPDTPPPRA